MPILSSAHSISDTALRDHELSLQFAALQPHRVHKVLTYSFRIVNASTREEVGGINLRAATNSYIRLYAGHVGCTIYPQHRGHNYASRAMRLLMPVARSLRLDPLWITCDPQNSASRRACELAGAEFVEIVDVPATCVIHQSGHTQKCRYKLALDS